MTILRIIFANKDPLLMLHMLEGGGDFISYRTANRFLEYLEVHDAIKEQGMLEQRQEHEKQLKEQETKRKQR